MDTLRELSVGRLLETFASHPLTALGAAVLFLSMVYTLVRIISFARHTINESLLLTTPSVSRCRRAVAMSPHSTLHGPKSNPRML